MKYFLILLLISCSKQYAYQEEWEIERGHDTVPVANFRWFCNGKKLDTIRVTWGVKPEYRYMNPIDGLKLDTLALNEIERQYFSYKRRLKVITQ